MGSQREVQEFVVSPDSIKELQVGQFVASIKTQAVRQIIRLRMAPRFGNSSQDKTNELMQGRTRALAPIKARASKWDEIKGQAGETK